MQCFYHNDPDGKVSAYLVKKFHQSRDNYPTKFHEMDYTKRIDFSAINEKETIYIVDFSISLDDMIKLLEITKDIVWIDHHISAIKKYDNFEYTRYIQGIRYDGIAGCLLTYLYFKYPYHIKDLESFSKTNKDKKFVESYIKNIKTSNFLPQFVKLTQDWDTWDLKFRSETIPFIYAFNSYKFDPSSNEEWSLIDNEKDKYLKDFISEGKSILRYAKRKNLENCHKYAFQVKFEGLNCLALDTTEKSSLTFEDIENKSYYDAFIVFNYTGNLYSYSIYSSKPDVDCSVIASKYGGGGHKSASGFTSKKLVFEL